MDIKPRYDPQSQKKSKNAHLGPVGAPGGAIPGDFAIFDLIIGFLTQKLCLGETSYPNGQFLDVSDYRYCDIVKKKQ